MHLQNMLDCLVIPLAHNMATNMNHKGGKKTKKKGGARKTSRRKGRGTTPALPDDLGGAPGLPDDYGAGPAQISPLSRTGSYLGQPFTGYQYASPRTPSPAPSQKHMLGIRFGKKGTPDFDRSNDMYGEQGSIDDFFERSFETIDDLRPSQRLPRMLLIAEGFLGNLSDRDRLSKLWELLLGRYVGHRDNTITYQYNQQKNLNTRYGKLKFKPSPYDLPLPDQNNSQGAIAKRSFFSRTTGVSPELVKNPSYKSPAQPNTVGNNLKDLLSAIFSKVKNNSFNYVAFATWYIFSSIIIVFSQILNIPVRLLTAILNSSSELNRYVISPAIDVAFIYMMYSLVSYTYLFVFGSTPEIAEPLLEGTSETLADSAATAAAAAAREAATGAAPAAAAAAAAASAAAAVHPNGTSIVDAENMLENITRSELNDAAAEAEADSGKIENLNVSNGSEVPSVVYESDILPKLNPKPTENSTFPFKTTMDGTPVTIERTGSDDSTYMYKVVSEAIKSPEDTSSILGTLLTATGVTGLAAGIYTQRDRLVNVMERVAERCNYRRSDQSPAYVSNHNDDGMTADERHAMRLFSNNGGGYKGKKGKGKGKKVKSTNKKAKSRRGRRSMRR